MSKVTPPVNIQIPSYILDNIRDKESSHQYFVNKKLSPLVQDSTSVGTILGNFLAARTIEFTCQSSELQTDAAESIAACALVANTQGGDFFEHFTNWLEKCSWTFDGKEESVQPIDINSRDPKRVVNNELEKSLRLDHYLLAKLAVDGLEDDISLAVKDALSSIAVKGTGPVTVQFMVGVLDFDITVEKGKVFIDFVYFTYQLEEHLDFFGTKTCYDGVRTSHISMSFNADIYQNENNKDSMKAWVKALFYDYGSNPPKPTDLRKAYIQEILLHNNIVSLTDNVTKWVGDHTYFDQDNEKYSIIVKKNADYENSAFNMVLFRCIQVFGGLKRHGSYFGGNYRKQTLDITVYLHVPLWGPVRLGTGFGIFEEALRGDSQKWEHSFDILPGVATCKLTFDIEKDPELWCAAELNGPLTGPLKTKVHILDVQW